MIISCWSKNYESMNSLVHTVRQKPLVTSRIRSMGKVMFSQVFVCSQGWGGVCLLNMELRICLPGVGGGGGGQPAGVMHPTGMHSCFIVFHFFCRWCHDSHK